jgi:KEOPS complex subunit Cgi121
MRVVEGTVDLDSVDGFIDRIAAVSADTDVTVQAFDARYIVDREHLARAVAVADRAIANDAAIATDRAVEFLVSAAGRRQINRAMEMGVSEGHNDVVILLDHAGDDESAEAAAVEHLGELVQPAQTLGQFDEDRVKTFFDISEAELGVADGTLADLVRERVALLPVEK